MTLVMEVLQPSKNKLKTKMYRKSCCSFFIFLPLLFPELQKFKAWLKHKSRIPRVRKIWVTFGRYLYGSIDQANKFL
jgi:hypothetical protein